MAAGATDHKRLGRMQLLARGPEADDQDQAECEVKLDAGIIHIRTSSHARQHSEVRNGKGNRQGRARLREIGILSFSGSLSRVCPRPQRERGGGLHNPVVICPGLVSCLLTRFGFL